MLKVKVRNPEKLDSDIRRLRKMCERDGLMKEMKRMICYEKPSEIKRRKKKLAKKRARQHLDEHQKTSD